MLRIGSLCSPKKSRAIAKGAADIQLSNQGDSKLGPCRNEPVNGSARHLHLFYGRSSSSMEQGFVIAGRSRLIRFTDRLFQALHRPLDESTTGRRAPTFDFCQVFSAGEFFKNLLCVPTSFSRRHSLCFADEFFDVIPFRHPIGKITRRSNHYPSGLK